VRRSAVHEIRSGRWKIHILQHVDEREVWGRWPFEELAEHGHELSPGTLYPVLERMIQNGWLSKLGDRRYHRGRVPLRTTAQGRRLLASLRREITGPYDEVVRVPRRRTSPSHPRRSR
jgi:DNA-binding PadR family transcriptional regulator